MWYNELLFVLMFVALIGMGVMALIVKVNMGKREGRIEKEAEAPGKTHEPEVYARQEPAETVEPEPEPEETVDIGEALLKTIVIQAAEPEPEPEPTLEPAMEPLITPHVEEEPEPVIEPPTETMGEPEPTVEPPASPTPEPDSAQPEPLPEATGRRRETENQFFDLRYEYHPQNAVADSPTILDEAPSIDLEEEEEGEEEPPRGVVTCPHCKSEVPNTLYCIYCGNTLAAKPQATKS